MKKQGLDLKIKNLLGLVPQINSMSGSARNDINDKYLKPIANIGQKNVKKRSLRGPGGIKKKKMIGNTFAFRKNKTGLPEVHQY